MEKLFVINRDDTGLLSISVILSHNFSKAIVVEKCVVAVNKTISKHFGVFTSLVLEYHWIRSVNSQNLGIGSCDIELEHFGDKQSPDIQFLYELHSLIAQLHRFLRRLPEAQG